MKKNEQTIIKAVLLSTVSTAIFWLILNSPVKDTIRSNFGNANLPAMAICTVIYFLLLILFRSVKFTLSKGITICFFIFVSIFLFSSYFQERKIFDAQNNVGIELQQPKIVYIPCTIAICILFIFVNSNINFKHTIRNSKYSVFLSKHRITLIITLITGLSAVGLSAYNHYSVNFTNIYNSHHLHAYINSIMNLFWGEPFSNTNGSIYGHYAFFYLPVLKMAKLIGFDNYYKVYMLTSCFLIFFTLALWCIVLMWNVKGTLLRIVGILVICSCNISRVSGIYHQTFPHRAFPIALTTFLISLWYKEKKKVKIFCPITIIGYFICTLLIIWSTEYGIFSCVAWSALHCCSALQTPGGIKQWCKVFLYCLMIPVSFGFALLFSGILNILLGGEMISIKDFIFPLLSNNYMQGMHEHDLASFPSAWMSIMVMLFILSGFGLKDTVLLKNECVNNDQSAVCFAISVLGLGAVTYAINRPAYGNFYLILPIAGLILVIFSEAYQKDQDELYITERKSFSSEHIFASASGIVSSCVLFMLVMITIINIPRKFEQNSYNKNFEPVRELAYQINKTHDKNALAVGPLVSLVYSVQGQDPGIYYYDISDITFNQSAYDKLTGQLKKMSKRSVFVSYDAFRLLPKEFLSTHIISSTFIGMGNIKIRYYLPFTVKNEIQLPE